MKIKDIFSNWIVNNFWKKFFIMFVSIFFMGFTLSLLVQVGWGTDPFSFMNLNLACRMGWSLGNWQLLFNAVLFIFMLVFNWRLIGFGTIVNMVLIGYTVDFFSWIWKLCGLTAAIDGSFILKLTVFSVAIVFFIISAAVYINSGMGLSPYDATINIISSWLKKIPFFLLRIIYDILAIAVGFFATYKTEAGMQGSVIGATVVALCLGPVISFTGAFMKKHFKIFQDETVPEKTECED